MNYIETINRLSSVEGRLAFKEYMGPGSILPYPSDSTFTINKNSDALERDLDDYAYMVQLDIETATGMKFEFRHVIKSESRKESDRGTTWTERWFSGTTLYKIS